MDTAIGTFQADKQGDFTPTLGEVKPRDIFWLGRREIENTVTNLGKALARDDSFFHPILVRDEGVTGYRGIAGFHRVEASKRRCGEDRPIPAIIYPAHTPDALIAILEIEENLLRKELTATEREAQTIRLAAALKRLNGGHPVVPVSESGEAAESGKRIPILTQARRGRGNRVWRSGSPTSSASASAR
jgi:hypothetical protein